MKLPPHFSHYVSFNAIVSIFNAIDMNVRAQKPQQVARIVFLKPCYVIDHGQGSNHFHSFLKGNNRSSSAFIPFDGIVSIERDNKNIGCLGGFVEDVEMAGVEEIE